MEIFYFMRRAHKLRYYGNIHSLTLGAHAQRGLQTYSSCLVCLSVCMYVCLSEHAILAVRAVRSRTKDAIVLSVRFAAILKRRGREERERGEGERALVCMNNSVYTYLHI